MNILEELFNHQDLKYRDFEANLTPTVNKECFIGVRTPILREMAKKIDINDAFLDELPHKYFEENQLHAFVISNIKDYDLAIKRLEEFLPYVDNWATCDQMKFKVFKKHKKEVLLKVKEWLKSRHEYTIRFGIEVLMNYYLEDDFDIKHLELVNKLKKDTYYVNMMMAWYYATALAKQRDAVLPFILEDKINNPEVKRMTIRKAIESFRISDEDKCILREFYYGNKTSK
ncbi:MAG: DNA alkylation repair protein [Erysipelotrichaceae bacterium]|nr:DNA alkylation repair protein [Erysipelotrichaceae bacterium]